MSPGQMPTIRMVELETSRFCFPWDATIFPVTSTEHPVVSLSISNLR